MHNQMLIPLQSIRNIQDLQGNVKQVTARKTIQLQIMVCAERIFAQRTLLRYTHT